MKEYNSGDVVTIRRLKDLLCEFRTDYEGNRWGGDYLYNNNNQGILCADMNGYTGRTTTIDQELLRGYYSCDIDMDFRFHEALFE